MSTLESWSHDSRFVRRDLKFEIHRAWNGDMGDKDVAGKIWILSGKKKTYTVVVEEKEKEVKQGVETMD